MYMFLPANVRIWCNAIEKNHEYCNLFAKQSIQVRPSDKIQNLAER